MISHFEQYGKLSDVSLMIDKRTGLPRGFAFIKFKDDQVLDQICSMMHVLDGRIVDVKRAMSRDQVPSPIRSESKKIFVGGLSPDISEATFHDYFSKFGNVKEVTIMFDRVTTRSRGFGFVTFGSEEEVKYVLHKQSIPNSYI